MSGMTVHENFDRRAMLAGVTVMASLFAAFADTRHFKPSSTAGWADPDSYEEGTVPSKARPSNYTWAETVVIPENSTVEVNDADWSVVKICHLKLEKGSCLKMNLTTALGGSYWGFDYNQLEGSGSIEKAGNYLLCQTSYEGNFSGSWIISTGYANFIYENNSVGNGNGAIYVRDGAYVDCSGYSNYGLFPQFTLGMTTVHIAGDGAGTGALSAGYYSFSTNTYKRVVLDADASVSTWDGTIGFCGKGTEKGLLDLAGHDFYLKGGKHSGAIRSCDLTLMNILVTNSVPSSGGRIILGGPNSATHYLNIRDGVVFDRSVQIVTRKGGKVRVYADAGQAATEVAAKLVTTTDSASVEIAAFTSEGQKGSVNWSGDIEVPEGVTFKAPSGVGGEQFVISGDVTGGGNLKVENQNLVSFTGDNSGFTGGLTVNDFYCWTGLRFGAPSSVPADYSKVTLNGSTLVVPFPAWTFSQYLALANGVTVNDSNGFYVPSVTIDPSACPDSTYELNVADGDVTNGKVALGVGGEGTVAVKSLPASDRIGFVAWNGLLDFTGLAKVAPGPMLATSFRDADHPGRILFKDNAEVDIASNPVWIGTPYLVEANARGEVVVTNSVVHNAEPKQLAEREGFFVGNSGYGRLVFQDSVVTSRVHVGVEKGGVGEFIVRGGKFCHWGGGNSAAVTNMLMVGNGGHGYVEIDNAQVDCRGYAAIGRIGSGSGVWVQKGGAFTMRAKSGDDSTPIQFHVGCRKGGDGVRTAAQYRLTGGGKVSLTHDTYVAAIGNDGTYDKYTYGTFTIDGEGSRYECGPFGIGEGKLSTGIVNLNDGGTLYAKTFRGTSATRYGKGYLNFNGGIYDHRGWGQQYLFGQKADAANEYDRAITRVTVYGRGATIISSSSSKSRKFGQPIHNATGKGVGAVPWTDLQEFVGAPVVIIEGDGYGASAIADYDAEHNVVTNITVTSPGCDYTYATAYVMQADKTNAVVQLDADLADNDQNGPVEFRFTDVGSFIFDVANDYKGETVLSSKYWDAQFNITNKDAFAKSSAIKLKGGTLYLANHTLDDLTAPFKFMGGMIAGEASAYAVPEGKMVIDLEDVAAGEQYTVVNNTNLTLPNTVPLWNGDSAALDENVKYTLLKLPASLADVKLSFTGIPKGWHVSRSGLNYRLCHDSGSMLLIK